MIASTLLAGVLTVALVAADDGACIEGDCENGYGTYDSESDGSRYEGQFEDGYKHGRGVLIFPEGGGT